MSIKLIKKSDFTPTEDNLQKLHDAFHSPSDARASEGEWVESVQVTLPGIGRILSVNASGVLEEME